MGAIACGGSSIDGSSIERPEPWVIGAEAVNADADEAYPDEAAADTEEASSGLTPRPEGPAAEDASIERDTSVIVLDSVSPPDAFPGPDNRECPEGTLCELGSAEPCYEGRCNALGECIADPIVGCCLDDEGCSALVPSSACDTYRCVANVCVPFTRPGCCSSLAECDDTESCTDDICLSGPGGRCVNCPIGCGCPDALPLHVASFDSPSLASDGYGVSDQHFDDVTWRLSTRRFISPPSAAWLGDAECPTYHSGPLGLDCQPSSSGATAAGPVQAELISPAIVLPDLPGGHVASFWLWSDVEPLSTGGTDERDVLTVSVKDLIEGISWPLSSSLYVGKSTGGAWQQMAIDLTPWQGKTISLRFSFDTLDGSDNHHEGVYIDELRIEARCQTGCCEFDADCPASDPTDPCTTRACVALSDGGGSTCLRTPSSPGAACDACTNDASCDDDNPCTEDSCSPSGTCEHVSFCCLELSSYETSFEGGLSGWYVSDAQPGDNVTWTTSEVSASDGLWAAWLGDPASGTYEAPGAVSATLQSPQIELPAATDEEGEVRVRFALNLSTEWDGFDYDNPAGIDRLKLELVITGQELIELWSSDEVFGSTQGAWQDISVSLQPWAAKSVKLRFVFETGDEARNDYAGPRIDDLRVGRVCP